MNEDYGIEAPAADCASCKDHRTRREPGDEEFSLSKRKKRPWALSDQVGDRCPKIRQHVALKTEPFLSPTFLKYPSLRFKHMPLPRSSPFRYPASSIAQRQARVCSLLRADLAPSSPRPASIIPSPLPLPHEFLHTSCVMAAAAVAPASHAAPLHLENALSKSRSPYVSL